MISKQQIEKDVVESSLGQLEVGSWPPGTEGSHKKSQTLVRMVSDPAKIQTGQLADARLLHICT